MKSKWKRIYAGAMAAILSMSILATNLQAADLAEPPKEVQQEKPESQAPEQGEQQMPETPGQGESQVTEPPGQDESQVPEPPGQGESQEQEGIQTPPPENAGEQGEQAFQDSVKQPQDLLSSNGAVLPIIPGILDQPAIGTSEDPIKKLRNALAVRNTGTRAATLDIKDGNIVILAGGYKQSADVNGGSTIIPVSDKEYNISGTSDQYTITVDAAVAKDTKIILNGLSIAVTADRRAALHVLDGANAEITITGDVKLQSGAYAAGLQIDPGAAASVTGTGTLTAISGNYAAGIGGSNSTTGGGLNLGAPTLKAYGKIPKGAIDTAPFTTAKKVAQGSLKAPVAVGESIILENMDDYDNEKYEIVLPENHTSFAVNLRAAGGEYTSYLKSDESTKKLLADSLANKRNVYDLKKEDMVHLDQLFPQDIRFGMTFDANGGAFKDGSKAITKGGIPYKSELAPLAEDEKPTLTNNELLGWYTSKDYTVAWDFSKKIVRDTTLFAKWQPTFCTVKFNDDKGNTLLTKIYTYGVKIPVADAPSVASDPNKIWAGWYVTPGGIDPWNFDNDSVVVENLTLTAKWLSQHSVSFDANTGRLPTEPPFSNLGSMPTAQKITDNFRMEEPAVKPTGNNYTFAGWYTDQTCTKKWDFTADRVKNNIVFYAKWLQDKCYITLNYNNDQASGKKEVNYNELMPAIDKPGKKPRGGDYPTDYIFKEWYKDALLKVPWDFANDRVTSNIALYAKWAQEQYYVTYKDGVSADQITAYRDGVIAEADVPKPTKTGHTFKWWYKDNKFTKWDFSVALTNDVVLNAYFEPDNYTITFDGSSTDAVSVPAPQKVEYNRPISKPAPPTRRGYVFDGNWYTDKSCTTAWDFTKLIGAGDMTLYAKWIPIEYKIIYESNGGTTVADPDTYHYGDKISNSIPPAAPTKTHYTFDNWYKDSNTTLVWDFVEFKVSQGTLTEDITDPVHPKGTMTLYAKWTPENYKVTFHAKAGEPVIDPEDKERTIPYLGFVETPSYPDVPRLGYTLEGWYTEDTFENKWVFKESVTPPPREVRENLDLYAHWTQDEYTVTFETFTEDVAVEEKIHHYDELIALSPEEAAPERAHYTFDKWYQEHENGVFTKPWDFEKNKVKGSMTLYAKWIPDEYTVTFLTGEGEPGLSPKEKEQTIIYNEFVETPKNYPAKPWNGHILEGWYTEPEFENKWEFKGSEFSTPVEKDITLYAKWTREEYTIQFVTGTDDVDTPVAKIVFYDDKLDPIVLERPHYEFGGWYKSAEFVPADKWDFAAHKVKGNMTLYAKWTIHNYTVTYEMKKEDGSITKTKETLPYGSERKPPATEERPGYTFNGWYTDKGSEENPGLTGKWDFVNQSVVEDMTLYSEWTKDIYNVDFVTNGGIPVPDRVQCEYDDTVAEPDPANNPVREHYTFDGWFHEPECTTPWNFKEDKIKKHTEIYAKWVPKTYVVTFVTNEGTKLDPLKVTYGDPIGTTYPVSTLLGYTLASWHTDEQLTSEPWKLESALVAGDTTLYAKWTQDQYVVSYQFDDGIIEKDTNTYTYGSLAIKPEFAMEHMTLNGWFKDKEYKTKWVYKRDRVKSDTTLYAFWSATEYTIHFETYDGTVIPDIIAVWGDQIPEPAAPPERVGYKFTGWYKDAEGTIPWDFEEDFIEGDVAIYSGWIANIYTITFDADGGTPVPEPQSIAHGKPIVKPEDPAKEGFTFIGWAGARTARAAVWNFDTDTVSDDTTMTAQWEAVKEPDPPVTDPPVTDPPVTDPPVTDPPVTDPPAADSPATNSPTANPLAAQPPAANNTNQTPNADAVKAAADELLKGVKNIVTGDNTQVVLWVILIIISAVLVIRILVKKIK